MFDFNSICDLKPDEILLLSKLQPIAEEAKRISKLICDTYKFRINEHCIEVWRDRDANNFEYLTHSGVWQARYLHQSYDVECTPEGIYSIMVANFMIENGFADWRTDTEISNKSTIFKYFKRFVAITQEKAAPQDENLEDSAFPEELLI